MRPTTRGVAPDETLRPRQAGGGLKRVPFTCTLDCGSRCELVACVQDGRLVRIDTPPGRPDSITRPRLVPCARGRAQRRLLTSPERLTAPLRRVGPRGSDQFVQVGWDEALDEVAARLTSARERFGSEAVLHATGGGSISGRGFSGADASRRFFSFWGSATEASGNESYYCAEMAARWMLGGTVPGSDRATLLDSNLIVLWGMNPAENRMAPNTEHFVAEARDRGAKVVLIDPRYTDSGVLADQWIPICPNTDVALMAALGYVLESDGLVDRAFMATHTVGYERYRRYLLGDDDGVPKTPGWAEEITGVPSATISELGRSLAANKPVALLPGWGPQRSLYGEQFARAMITLACMSGNVGIRGGGLASVGTRSASNFRLEWLPWGPHARGRHLPLGAWAADMLADRLHPPLRMAYVVASNLVNRSRNTVANIRALEQLECVVVNEQFLTPTARYADIVLPVCSDLERGDLVTSWGYDAHLFYSQQAIAPLGASRTDYWIFSQLAERMGFGSDYTTGKTEAQWLEHLFNTSDLDVDSLRREGVLRTDGEPRTALEDFRRDPVSHPLNTPSGRIEIVSPQARAYGLPAIPSYVEEDTSPADEYPLRLLTPHSKLRSNSSAHANDWLRRLEPHAVWLNPRDARPRGIRQGDQVEVESEAGKVLISAKVTERIVPGVVCIYQGTWYAPGEDGVDRGGCANVLTSHRQTPTGGFVANSAWVEVRSREA